MNPIPEAQLDLLFSKDPRFSGEAYVFVGQAVEYTVGKLKKRRHVSALELLKGAVEFSRQEYGAVRELVLRQWGIASAGDLGDVVYLLIGVGLLSASPGDAPEDFHVDFDLFAEPAVPKAPVRLPLIDGAPPRNRRRKDA